jgi:ABC-type nitrate/sulfonate/bicarbonate transport system substrate-binding protein
VEANALDAAVVTPAERYQAQQLGLTSLFDVGTISPPFSVGGLVMSEQYTRERPEVVLRFLRAHQDGLKRLRAEPAWGKQVLSRWLQIDDQAIIDDSYETYARRYLPDIPRPTVEAVAPIVELLALTDPRAAQLAPESLIAPQFFQQLEAEGFFQKPPGSR